MLLLLSSSVAMMLAMVMATANRDEVYDCPADAFLSGSISSCAENGFARNATHPEAQRSLANGRVVPTGHVNHRHGKSICLETVP
jgi:hypothetical protein